MPGYAAPADTIVAAARTPIVLIRILADGFAAGTLCRHEGRPARRQRGRALTDAIRADWAGPGPTSRPRLPIS